MSIDFATLVSLIANVVLVIFGAALAFLLTWEDPRRRSNQYLALCMLLFALYGAVNTPFLVAQQYDLDPRRLMQVLISLYLVGVVLVFSFVLSFGGLPARVRRIERVLSTSTAAVFLALAWTDHMFTQFELLSSGGYRFRLTTIGMVGAALLAVYLLGVCGLLFRYHSPLARELSIPVVILVAGVLIVSCAPGLRRFSVNALAIVLSVAILGRLVLKVQLFQPLADLNSRLSITNAELFEATRLKSQFLANMSHELRTPLNSIIGYTELVLNGTYGDLTSLQRDRLHKVNRNGRRLLELINDVLDLSKIEAGRLELSRTRVNTTDLLDGLLARYELQAVEKGLALVRGYGHLPALDVDAGRARQVLDNLLSNAIKFTQQGVVIVRAYPDATRQQVVISIADTGPGIDPAQQELVYHAFHHVDGTLKSECDGTGLGLALAFRLVALHGGNLWFESVVGQGTTFHVALPAADQAAPLRTIRPTLRAGGPALLVIDDDREAVEVMQDQLERAGFRVFGVCTAADGLRMVHEIHPALIILDLKMPDMDGWQVLQALRRDPASATTPVMIVSATDRPETPLSALQVDGYITKPVRAEALVNTVRRLLQPALAQAGERLS